MERIVKGDVVVVPFPFSNLTRHKRRPALVVTKLQGDDVIFCQITSKSVSDSYAIALTDNDFKEGSLKQASMIRPNRIFTADQNIILYRIGGLKNAKMYEVVNEIEEIIRE